MPLVLLLSSTPDNVLVPYAPEARQYTQETRDERDIIRHPVAAQPFIAASFTTGLDLRVSVIDCPIEQVVDISAHNGRKSHEAPVHAQTIDTECICH